MTRQGPGPTLVPIDRTALSSPSIRRRPIGNLALPRTFEPDYGTVVTRVLPGIVAMMSACGAFFLAVASSGTALWLGLASFGVGAAFLLLYLWYLIYREIEFGEQGVVIRRYLFPDVEGPYGEVTGVSPRGFRLDGFPVACHTMENAPELHAILDELREREKIEPSEGGGLSRDFRENLAATAKAAVLGVGLWVLIATLDLAPEGVPDALASYGVILVTLVVGAPLIKRFSSE